MTPVQINIMNVSALKLLLNMIRRIPENIVRRELAASRQFPTRNLRATKKILQYQFGYLI